MDDDLGEHEAIVCNRDYGKSCRSRGRRTQTESFNFLDSLLLSVPGVQTANPSFSLGYDKVYEVELSCWAEAHMMSITFRRVINLPCQEKMHNFPRNADAHIARRVTSFSITLILSLHQQKLHSGWKNLPKSHFWSKALEWDFWTILHHCVANRIFLHWPHFEGTLMESAKQVCTELFMAELTLVTLSEKGTQKEGNLVLLDDSPPLIFAL